MPQSHPTRLTDRDALVSALADLAAHREDVALRLPDTRHSTMFFVDSVDAERGQIVFESVPEAAEPSRAGSIPIARRSCTPGGGPGT